MKVTKHIIQMTHPLRPDFDYFYAGQNKEGCPVFELKKSKAKRYDTLDEASRDAFLLQVVHKDNGKTYTVVPVRQRA